MDPSENTAAPAPAPFSAANEKIANINVADEIKY